MESFRSKSSRQIRQEPKDLQAYGAFMFVGLSAVLRRLKAAPAQVSVYMPQYQCIPDRQTEGQTDTSGAVLTTIDMLKKIQSMWTIQNRQVRLFQSLWVCMIIFGLNLLPCTGAMDFLTLETAMNSNWCDLLPLKIYCGPSSEIIQSPE